MLPQVNNLFRLSRDPELLYSSSGMAICRAGLVASQRYKEDEKQLWIDATAFGKMAELLHTVKKGQRVFVSGRLMTESWTSRDGSKRTSTRLLIDSFEFVERREERKEVPVEHRDANGNVTATGSMPSRQSGVPDVNIDEDDIPF